MSNIDIKINTLNSLLPHQAPIVVAQVSAAVELATVGELEEVAEKRLDLAIQVADQVSKYRPADLLFDYTPIIIALVKDVEGADLSVFDTIDHRVPVGVVQAREFLNSYATATRRAASKFGEITDDAVHMVVMAELLNTAKEGRNLLNLAYMLNGLNQYTFVNGTFNFYCDLISTVNNSEF